MSTRVMSDNHPTTCVSPSFQSLESVRSNPCFKRITGHEIKLAVKLDSSIASSLRYLVVISSHLNEFAILGVNLRSNNHLNHHQDLVVDHNTISHNHMSQSSAPQLNNYEPTLGLVLPIFSDTNITLDGDGGFSISTASRRHIFKPVSVHGMWKSLQTLYKACATARTANYFEGGSSHKWTSDYEISSDRTCLNEWNQMDELTSKRPPSPGQSCEPREQAETKDLIRVKLKVIMSNVNLDEVTSKFIRTQLERELDMKLTEYKPFIDEEILRILGQMDSATQILPYLYLGSEWNASNFDELRLRGVKKILNVTREIDNFYPDHFDYFNIRVSDDDSTEMIKHWDKSYRIIRETMEEGAKVLVHCKMGISRSASVVIAYVMKAKNWNLDVALSYVKNKRSCVMPNDNFLKQLEIYQGILTASKQRHNILWRSKSETNLSTCTSSSSSTASISSPNFKEHP